MSRTPTPPPNGGKTTCRVEVVGKVNHLSFDPHTNCTLAPTILNGAHVFHMDDSFYGANLFTGMTASSVESYPSSVLGSGLLLCGCFAGKGDAISLGSADGSITTISRRSRAITSSYVMSAGATSGVVDEGEGDSSAFDVPVRSLDTIPDHPNAVLASTEMVTSVVDVEKSTAMFTLVTPVPRTVAAVALSSSLFATANYDGKVLVYDTRESLKPAIVLSIPDQITCLARCPETSLVCAGTVAGRVFTLRCVESTMREQAFGTGKRRSPIRSVSVYGNRIAAGDISGKLALLDASDVPNSTKYWSPASLLSRSQADDDADDSRGAQVGSTVGEWQDAEVTAVTMAKGIVWSAFCSQETASTQVVAMPA